MSELNTALSADQMEILDNDESGFESVSTNYRAPGKNLDVGDKVQGTFVKVEPNKFGGVNYVLRTASGIEVLNGCGSLNSQMEKAAALPGDTLRVTYEGKIKLTEGQFKGKDAHQYKVQIKRQSR